MSIDPFTGLPQYTSKRKKHSKLAVVLATWLGTIAGIVALYFTQAWLLMIFLGAVHLELWNKVPPFGWLASLLLTIAVNAVVIVIRSIIK